jgi:hypothetical protein
MRRTRAATRGLAAAALLLALAGCADGVAPVDDSTGPPIGESTDLPTDATVLLQFGQQLTVSQRGQANVEVSFDYLDEGGIQVVPGWNGEPAFDFPDYRDATQVPRAAVLVHNASDTDELSPGDAAFSWGADFTLDTVSLGSAVDNGDNLIQRGIASFREYFKAEVDQGHPACTVAGDEGTVYVRSYRKVEPDTWYRLICHRTADQLSISVTEVTPSGGSVKPVTSTESGRAGTLSFEDPDTPLAIGGKVGANAKLIRSATDEFNGLVMNPFLVIED